MTDARDASAARDAVLARIGRALGTGHAAAPERPAFAFRTRSEAPADERVAEFIERIQGYKVRVERASVPEAMQAIARILAARGHVRIAVPADLPDDLRPEGFDLVADHGLGVAEIGACDGVLTMASCAIAQTGTLVLDHGPGQGRRALTLLPDYHLCVVRADTVLGLVPEAVAMMAPSVRAGRPLTFVSGPSATSDIELNRVEGVHGPRTLDVLILD